MPSGAAASRRSSPTPTAPSTSSKPATGAPATRSRPTASGRERAGASDPISFGCPNLRASRNTISRDSAGTSATLEAHACARSIEDPLPRRVADLGLVARATLVARIANTLAHAHRADEGAKGLGHPCAVHVARLYRLAVGTSAARRPWYACSAASAAAANEGARGARVRAVGSAGLKGSPHALGRPRHANARARAVRADVLAWRRGLDPHPIQVAALHETSVALRGSRQASSGAGAAVADVGARRSVVRPNPVGVAQLRLVASALPRARLADARACAHRANERAERDVTPHAACVARAERRAVAAHGTGAALTRASTWTRRARVDAQEGAHDAVVPRTVGLTSDVPTALALSRSRGAHADAFPVRANERAPGANAAVRRVCSAHVGTGVVLGSAPRSTEAAHSTEAPRSTEAAHSTEAAVFSPTVEESRSRGGTVGQRSHATERPRDHDAD